MKDSVLLVTGGAGHIGSALARQMAGHGCNIAILDKDRSGAEKRAGALEAEFGVRTLVLDHDLSRKEEFDSVVADVEAAFGRIDFLVNNAAFYDDMPGWGVPFEEEGYDAWVEVMKVNLLAPFFLVQRLTPMLKASPHGSVVNVSSIYGMVGPDHGLYEGTVMTNPAAYAASKGGMNQITRWLATVLAPDVRVNTVTPGGVARGQNEAFVARYNKKTPLQRMATEDDIASAIAYLLSPASSYVTGQNLVVDGGWTVW